MNNERKRIGRNCNIVITALVWVRLLGSQVGAQQNLKVYISADMEGVVGAVTGDQLGPGGFEYSRFRTFLTNEVNLLFLSLS